MKILIDNGHGSDTAGKRSPDGRFREYKYNREIARSIVDALTAEGYDASLVVPEEEDIPLEERVRRINKIAMDRLSVTLSGAKGLTSGELDTFVVSIHVNAAGNGSRWMNATGWCAYTFPGHTESDRLATYLYEAAELLLPGHYLRKDYSDGDPDLEAPFYILRHTYCAAVLTENGFMDNVFSLAFLESDEGRKAIINLHVEGIRKYVHWWQDHHYY